MNVPFKNITKVDTSKGVPVWTTSMVHIRAYPALVADGDAARQTEIASALTDLVALIRKHFLDGRDIGTHTILLSIACINFLANTGDRSLSAEHAAIIREYLDLLVHSKFGGIAYTGNSDKNVTVTRDTIVPSMLPFVLRERDPLVAGYGVYVARITVTHRAGLFADRDFSFFVIDDDASTFSQHKKDECVAKLLPPTINTLYNDHTYADADWDALIAKHGSAVVYVLFANTAHDVETLAAKHHPWLDVCTEPILSIGTHDTTRRPFCEVGPSLAWSVRTTNSTGLAVTVATTGLQKKRSAGSLSCDTPAKRPRIEVHEAVPTLPPATQAETIERYKVVAHELQPSAPSASAMIALAESNEPLDNPASQKKYHEALLAALLEFSGKSTENANVVKDWVNDTKLLLSENRTLPLPVLSVSLVNLNAALLRAKPAIVSALLKKTKKV